MDQEKKDMIRKYEKMIKEMSIKINKLERSQNSQRNINTSGTYHPTSSRGVNINQSSLARSKSKDKQLSNASIMRSKQLGSPASRDYSRPIYDLISSPKSVTSNKLTKSGKVKKVKKIKREKSVEKLNNENLSILSGLSPRLHSPVHYTAGKILIENI
jgi:hypothetical protein